MRKAEQSRRSNLFTPIVKTHPPNEEDFRHIFANNCSHACNIRQRNRAGCTKMENHTSAIGQIKLPHLLLDAVPQQCSRTLRTKRHQLHKASPREHLANIFLIDAYVRILTSKINENVSHTKQLLCRSIGIRRNNIQIGLLGNIAVEHRGDGQIFPEYLTCWGPGLLRLGAIMSFGGYCVSRPGLLRLGAVVG